MPAISVIIPAYNAEKTILETIQSVQQQSFTDFELLVIDDGSTDQTVQTVATLADPRIQIFRYENGGVSAARNRGIAKATGDFLAFLDADDLWTTDKLELQWAALQQQPAAGVAYSWTAFMDVDAAGQAVFYPSQRYAVCGDVYRQLLVADFVHSGSNTLIRREAIATTGDFTLGIEPCADWDYWLRISTRWPFVVVPKYQILYRRTAGAMSSQVESMERAALAVVERAYAAAPAEVQPLRSQTMAGFHAYCADLYIRSGKPQDLAQAQRHLWQLVQLDRKALLTPHIQKMLLKFALKQLLPKSWANSLLSVVRQPVTISDPRTAA
jgi:glycosyltransferase involved in cell wall biosynthesis